MRAKFRRNDLVVLPDDTEAKVLVVLNTENIHIYKVKREYSIDYFDESKLRLRKRSFMNFIFDFLSF